MLTLYECFRGFAFVKGCFNFLALFPKANDEKVSVILKMAFYVFESPGGGCVYKYEEAVAYRLFSDYYALF